MCGGGRTRRRWQLQELASGPFDWIGPLYYLSDLLARARGMVGRGAGPALEGTAPPPLELDSPGHSGFADGVPYIESLVLLHQSNILILILL